jgi:hypothetical protein
MGRRLWVRTAAAIAGAATVLLAGACSSEPESPPAPQHLVEFSATGPSGGTAFGRYVMVGQLGSNQDVTFSGLPYQLSLPVGFEPAPKMQVSLVGVPPNSRVSCKITVDHQVIAAATATAPGQDAICAAP